MLENWHGQCIGIGNFPLSGSWAYPPLPPRTQPWREPPERTVSGTFTGDDNVAAKKVSPNPPARIFCREETEQYFPGIARPGSLPGCRKRSGVCFNAFRNS